MPANKNALLRYQIIDSCLKNRGRLWTWKDIQNEVNRKLRENDSESKGVGKTTIFEDLKDIEYRIFNADIERIPNGKTQYLRYKDPHFSINGQPLSTTEVNQLNAAIQVLTRFKGNPQFDWIYEMIHTLESKLGLITLEKPVMTFESNVDYHGLTFITQIFNAILNKRVLLIQYQDFKSSIPYEITFHPYHLKQFNHRWYVIGFNSNGSRLENKALDRIKSIEESSLEYIDNNMDWDDYFSDFIGVTRMEGYPIEIKISILSSVQAAYIRTNPIHQTQKPIREVDNGFETSIKVIPNFELEKLLLSFGEQVKVISPLEFKNKLSERVKKLYQLYS